MKQAETVISLQNKSLASRSVQTRTSTYPNPAKREGSYTCRVQQPGLEQPPRQVGTELGGGGASARDSCAVSAGKASALRHTRLKSERYDKCAASRPQKIWSIVTIRISWCQGNGKFTEH